MKVSVGVVGVAPDGLVRVEFVPGGPDVVVWCATSCCNFACVMRRCQSVTVCGSATPVMFASVLVLVLMRWRYLVRGSELR